MVKFIRFFTILLLILNMAGGFYGGVMLMMDPTGASIGLPDGLLEGSAFNSYFIPGLVLFVLNGIMSLVVMLVLLFNHRNQGTFTFSLGFLSGGFILVEILTIRQYYFLQLIFGGVSLLFVILGFILLLNDKRPSRLPGAGAQKAQ